MILWDLFIIPYHRSSLLFCFFLCFCPSFLAFFSISQFFKFVFSPTGLEIIHSVSLLFFSFNVQIFLIVLPSLKTIQGLRKFEPNHSLSNFVLYPQIIHLLQYCFLQPMLISIYPHIYQYLCSPFLFPLQCFLSGVHILVDFFQQAFVSS